MLIHVVRYVHQMSGVNIGWMHAARFDNDNFICNSRHSLVVAVGRLICEDIYGWQLLGGTPS